MITKAQKELFVEHQERQLVELYGSGALFADGIIVEARKLFGFDLKKAFEAYCSSQSLKLNHLDALSKEYENYFKKAPTTDCLKRINQIEHQITRDAYARAHWFVAFTEYTDLYFDGRLDIARECIERVALWKTWCTTVKA